jgi:hypothetical protein
LHTHTVGWGQGQHGLHGQHGASPVITLGQLEQTKRLGDLGHWVRCGLEELDSQCKWIGWAVLDHSSQEMRNHRVHSKPTQVLGLGPPVGTHCAGKKAPRVCVCACGSDWFRTGVRVAEQTNRWANRLPGTVNCWLLLHGAVCVGHAIYSCSHWCSVTAHTAIADVMTR